MRTTSVLRQIPFPLENGSGLVIIVASRIVAGQH